MGSMDADLAAEVQRIGTDAGLDAVGVAPAEPFVDTRRHLEERKAAGLHGGMQFTYRNPARSTDPARAPPPPPPPPPRAPRPRPPPPPPLPAGRPHRADRRATPRPGGPVLL